MVGTNFETWLFMCQYLGMELKAAARILLGKTPWASGVRTAHIWVNFYDALSAPRKLLKISAI